MKTLVLNINGENRNAVKKEIAKSIQECATFNPETTEQLKVIVNVFSEDETPNILFSLRLDFDAVTNNAYYLTLTEEDKATIEKYNLFELVADISATSNKPRPKHVKEGEQPSRKIKDAARRIIDKLFKFADDNAALFGAQPPREEEPKQEPKEEAKQEPATAPAPTLEEPKELSGLEGMLFASMKPHIEYEAKKAAASMGGGVITHNYKVTTPSGATKHVKNTHKEFKTVLDMVTAGNMPYLWGDSGTGKSYLAEQIAEALDLKMHSISLTGSTPPEDLVGFFNVLQNKYEQSEFTRAFKTGGLCLIDETDNGNNNTTAGLNNILANGWLRFNDGTEEGQIIERHPNFVLICTGNTIGNGATARYPSRFPLDGGLKDRLVYHFLDYDTELEKTFAESQELVTEIQRLRARANELKLSSNIITGRAIVQAGKLMQAANWSIAKAIDATVYAKFTSSEKELLKKA